MLWILLSRFVFRLSFGVALAMSVATSREVTAGFFRVHLWVIMGLNTLAALAIGSRWQSIEHGRLLCGIAVTCGVLSYVGSVCWLYEKRRAGLIALILIAAIMLCGAVLTAESTANRSLQAKFLRIFDSVSSGMLVGTTLTSMLLGHWYLNTPTMKLRPLQQLIVFMVLSLALRGLVCAWVDVNSLVSRAEPLDTSTTALLLVRWIPGLCGTLVTAIMAWRTLKIPNTQSATGILYVSVIFAFLGELASMLLSTGSTYLV